MNNISLSFELICLMSWLIKNEKKGVKALIKLALDNGFADGLDAMGDGDSNQMPEHLYTTVTDFLLYLEQTLLQELNKPEVNPQLDLLPTVKKIDGELDGATLWQSMQQTRKELNRLQLSQPQQDSTSKREAEKLFLKTMLKNWNLTEEEIIN